MAIGSDFSWKELGARIRARRIARGITQQSLALASGLTQNGIFRLEAGETNPQLTTLQGLSKALGTTVRELLCGISEAEPSLAGRLSRVRQILDSGDVVAIHALDNGLENAEALLERGGRRREVLQLPKLIVKGQARRSREGDFSAVNELHVKRSEADDVMPITSDIPEKMDRPYRESSTRSETKKSNRTL